MASAVLLEDTGDVPVGLSWRETKSLGAIQVLRGSLVLQKGRAEAEAQSSSAQPSLADPYRVASGTRAEKADAVAEVAWDGR